MMPVHAINAGAGVALEAIGQADRLVSICPGLMPDFLVIDGDPAANVRLLTDRRSILQIYKGGVPLSSCGRSPGLVGTPRAARDAIAVMAFLQASWRGTGGSGSTSRTS